jgi:uncharacterized protein (DUF924 family)
MGSATIATPESVLSFWFGAADPLGNVAPECFDVWFGKDARLDAEIRLRFESLLDKAARGDLDHWIATPRGRLALIILLDQFPRNIYRGQPRAFAYDHKALSLAEEGLAHGADAQLLPIERVFMYLPLEHAEDADRQARAVACFQKLRDAVPDPQRGMYTGFLDYAVRHHEVIERFGRFPHRNATLGRPSTQEEQSFLRQPGSSF